MKKTKRSAFTIVELVIVIAVIAILSAVLIPTFGTAIKSANIASDQTAASTLTSELHVELKGETIDSEAELMKHISNIDAKKLTPKAAAYGVHYWFDMENQMIIAKTAEEVEAIKAERLSAATPVQEGAMLMNAVLTNETTTSTTANISFRDIYNCGIYLIDKGGSYIAEAINKIDSVTDGEKYAEIISDIAKAVEYDNDTVYVTLIQTTVTTTTIKNEAGSFFVGETSTYEYFSATATYIGNNYVSYDELSGETSDATAAPAPTGTVEIPSHIEFAVEGSLNYSSNVEITVSTGNEVTDVLTNGTINENVQVNVEGTIYVSNDDGNLETDDETAEETVIVLSLKLPFDDYNIGFVEGADVTGDNSKVYVAFRNKYLQLHAVNTANASETSNKVTKWEIVTEGAYGVVIDKKTGRLDLSNAVLIDNVCEVVVKATADNKNGETIERNITVVVVKPVSLTVTLSNALVYPVTDGITPEVTFNGALTSYGMKIGATYSGDKDGKNPLEITHKCEVSDLSGLIYDNGKLTFETDDEGNLVEGINFKYNVTIDGTLTKEINLEVKDATAAAVKFKYNQHLHDNRPNYQIGTNADGTNTVINLADLFKISNEDKLGTAKINIYATAEVGDALYPSYEIGNMFDKYAEAYANGDIDTNPYTLDADYTPTVTKGTWDSATITFKGTVTDSYKVFIEIIPEQDVSTVVRVDIVNNAINVTDISSLAKTHTTNVVLHKDVTATTGHKINLGANALYGNGWIINATSLKSSTLTTTNDYFISVSGGTVDNVYINGPVYPELEYLEASYGYHVSGIKSEGASTVQNSYIAGFRQPIQVNGGSLTLNESTLYGGTYANLQLIKGNLTLYNVTTVQPNEGIKDTFNATASKKNVIGLGIVVENEAVANSATSKITINGYLDQYNWVAENTPADLPKLTIDGSEMDMNVVLNAMFNGLEINFLGKDISRRLAFLDAYTETVNGVQYLNTGIMFMSIGTGDTAKNTYNVRNNLTVEDNRVAGGYIAPTKFTDQELPLFSTYVVMQKSVFKLYAHQMMRLLEDFTVRESDGVVTGSVSLNVFNSIANPIDAYLEVWTYNKDAVTLGSADYPINQTQGYYINYGN